MPGTGSEAIPGRQTHTRSGGEGEVSAIFIGAYIFAATLEVVSRLHLHASLDSTSSVETVHPLRVLDLIIVALYQIKVILIGSGSLKRSDCARASLLQKKARPKPKHYIT